MRVDGPNWNQGPFYLVVLLFIFRGTGLLAHMQRGLVRNKPRHFGVSNPHSLSPTWEVSFSVPYPILAQKVSGGL